MKTKEVYLNKRLKNYANILIYLIFLRRLFAEVKFAI